MKTISRNRIKPAKSDGVFDVINYLLLAVVFILCAYPLIFVLSASISDPTAVASGQMVLWPVKPTLDGYMKILQYGEIWRGYANTMVITLVGTLINLVMTVLFAYPLSRKDFRGRRAIMGVITVTMFFSGGMIPSYLVIRSLNLLDSIWALILPVALSAWNVIITRTYFETSIPPEMQEAASIDGCGNTRYLVAIVVPLSMPILAVMALYYSSAHWNSYFSALLYLSDEAKYPLQMVLRKIFILNNMSMDIISGDPELFAQQKQLSELIKYGVIVVSSLPMLALYPLIQKHFVKGVMVGSVKG
ncbi:MAG: carbohydrate ABC transporter permease [Clostridia bacterium]